MATIWKGAINFGLVNVPVKLSAAASSEGVSFRTLHKECGNPIKQRRWCEECDIEVDYADTVKGYEIEKDIFVPVTEQELKSAATESSKYIQIQDFIKLSEVDPIYFKKSYFLAPEKAGEKPYLILYRAMQQSGCVAVSTITIRDKEHLCLVRVYGDSLMLNTMYFGNEVRASEGSAEKLDGRINVSDAELVMAKQIVENLTKPFDPFKYTDTYTEKLLQVVHDKADGKQTKKPSERKPSAESMDLFERLKASVEATQSQSSKSGKKTKTAQKAKPVPKQQAQDYASN